MGLSTEEYKFICVPVRLGRYVPQFFNIPMDVGFRWIPQWSSSPVKETSLGVKGKLFSPFHRMKWDIFSVCFWDKAVILGAQELLSPLTASRLWPFKHENLDWTSRYFTPLFCYLFFPRVVYPG